MNLSCAFMAFMYWTSESTFLIGNGANVFGEECCIVALVTVGECLCSVTTGKSLVIISERQGSSYPPTACSVFDFQVLDPLFRPRTWGSKIGEHLTPSSGDTYKTSPMS